MEGKEGKVEINERTPEAKLAFLEGVIFSLEREKGRLTEALNHTEQLLTVSRNRRKEFLPGGA